VAGKRMAQPVYPQLRNTRAFPHLRFVPQADQRDLHEIRHEGLVIVFLLLQKGF
jgi:hypothetical protein